MATPSGDMTNTLYEMLTPIMANNKERWAFAKKFSTLLRQDNENSAKLLNSMFDYRPSHFPRLQKKEEKKASTIKKMTAEELEENVTILLRKSFKDGKVSDVSKLAEITDKLLTLFKSKDENKVTAINITVTDYKDLPKEIALETSEVQDYTGLMGDDWLKEAWEIISSMSAKDRIEWAKERGIFPSQVKEQDLDEV